MCLTPTAATAEARNRIFRWRESERRWREASEGAREDRRRSPRRSRTATAEAGRAESNQKVACSGCCCRSSSSDGNSYSSSISSKAGCGCCSRSYLLRSSISSRRRLLPLSLWSCHSRAWHRRSSALTLHRSAALAAAARASLAAHRCCSCCCTGGGCGGGGSGTQRCRHQLQTATRSEARTGKSGARARNQARHWGRQ